MLRRLDRRKRYGQTDQRGHRLYFRQPLLPRLCAVSGRTLGRRTRLHRQRCRIDPPLALALAVALWGIRGSQKKHGQRAPFLVGLGGAIAALVGLFVFVPLHVTGLILLVGASVWDIILLRRVPSSCDTPSR